MDRGKPQDKDVHLVSGAGQAEIDRNSSWRTHRTGAKSIPPSACAHLLAWAATGGVHGAAAMPKKKTSKIRPAFAIDANRRLSVCLLPHELACQSNPAEPINRSPPINRLINFRIDRIISTSRETSRAGKQVGGLEAIEPNRTSTKWSRLRLKLADRDQCTCPGIHS